MAKAENIVEKQNANLSEGIQEQNTGKKIGFISAIAIVVGSCIGAGIFLKAGGVLGDVQGSFVLAILAWIVAAVGVIAMALALVEITSATVGDDRGLMAWVKKFNNEVMYKASKNFMAFIYVPLTYFFMPIYVILQFQDAIAGFGGPNATAPLAWWAVMLIALAMDIWFIVVSGVSSRAGNIQNWIITAVKFLPLIASVLVGFIMAGMLHQPIDAGPVAAADGVSQVSTLTAMSPAFGLVLALSGIFFAFDGFYVACGIQSQMKQPKRTSTALVVGLSIVTGIYLLIAIAMMVASPGDASVYGFRGWMHEKNVDWIYGLLQLFIAIGIMGIINGFAMWAPRFVEDMIADDEIPFTSRFKNKLNPDAPWVGVGYQIVLAVPITIIFCVIGALAFADTTGYGPDYGSHSAEMYSFCDIMANWTALIAFSFIALSIAGGISNRKSKKVNSSNSEHYAKDKLFIPAAWVAVVIVFGGLAYAILQPFADLFIGIHIDYMADTYGSSKSPFGPAISSDDLLQRIMLVVMLFVFMAIMFVPIPLERKRHIKMGKITANN